MKKLKESLNNDLKNQIKNDIMSIPSFDINPIEAMKDINSYNKELGEESEETKEATSASGAGQFSQPLFSTTKKEVEEMMSKKVEATEATSTSSSGQYSTPAFVAKNSKNWRGGKKPLFPGGKFVKVKEKCKKFPYCNQGDIKALKLTESNINKIYNIFENDWEKEAKSNIDKTFDSMPKLKDLKNYGLKYSVKSLKNLLMKKTKPDGTFGDNKWNREELPFPKELDILNAIFQSRLAKFYFVESAKKKGKTHYDFSNIITKESLDNFPIPEPIFINVVQILNKPKDGVIETTIKKLANKHNVNENVIRTIIKNNFKETRNNSNQ